MLQTDDSGIVIAYMPQGFYYQGFNKLGKELRKAQIYHSEKQAQNAIKSLCEKKKLFENDFEIRNITIKLI